MNDGPAWFNQQRLAIRCSCAMHASHGSRHMSFAGHRDNSHNSPIWRRSPGAFSREETRRDKIRVGKRKQDNKWSDKWRDKSKTSQETRSESPSIAKHQQGDKFGKPVGRQVGDTSSSHLIPFQSLHICVKKRPSSPGCCSHGILSCPG